MKRASTIPTSHLFLPGDLHLFDYHQIYAVSNIWIEEGMEDVIGTYDLIVRDMPKNRNFLLFGGLEELIEGIRTWRYTKDEVDFLLKNTVITKNMAEKMRRFRYSGDVWAMPEGTVFFPGEPMVRLTGPMWEINLLTMFLINTLTSNTAVFSRAVRSWLAADGKVQVLSCPITRGHANEAAFKMGRAVYMLGATMAPLVPAFARKFRLPMSHVSTKAYHALITSFPTEIEAMRASARLYPNRIDFMADTYDFKQGVRNAIIVAEELREEGKTITGITIDSGKTVQDYIQQARWARRELDRAGFPKIRITAAGNFDEWRIAELVRAKAPVNGVIIGTEIVTISDDPKLEAVLKLAEIRRGREVVYKAKLAIGKESYPAQKQVYRRFARGTMMGDAIGLADEKLGTPLLKPMIRRGRVVYTLPHLDVIAQYTKRQIATLPKRLKDIHRQHRYPVRISSPLQKLFNAVKREHGKRRV